MVLRLHKPKTDKKIHWEEGVVDNEFMGKKKSKCESSLNEFIIILILGGKIYM